MKDLPKSIIAELELTHLSPQQQQDVQATAFGMLQAKIDQRLKPLLSDEQLKELDEITGDNSTAAVIAWVTEKVPDYQQIVEEETEKVVADMKAKKAEILAELGIQA
jgi:hypothetical protein